MGRRGDLYGTREGVQNEGIPDARRVGGGGGGKASSVENTKQPHNDGRRLGHSSFEESGSRKALRGEPRRKLWDEELNEPFHEVLNFSSFACALVHELFRKVLRFRKQRHASLPARTGGVSMVTLGSVMMMTVVSTVVLIAATKEWEGKKKRRKKRANERTNKKSSLYEHGKRMGERGGGGGQQRPPSNLSSHLPSVRGIPLPRDKKEGKGGRGGPGLF
jgi:hypothetical protein